MEKINALGKACPTPVIMAKKALEVPTTQAIAIDVDNETAVNNLKRLAGNIGTTYDWTEIGPSHYQVTMSKTENTNTAMPQEETFDSIECMIPTPGASTVLFTKDTMGSGADELGKILIKGFIYTLKELSPPPKCLLFVNSGVLLAKEGANTVDDLKDLEATGTEIIICGTCADYYNIKDQVSVGSIGDMYTIAGKMNGANLISL